MNENKSIKEKYKKEIIGGVAIAIIGIGIGGMMFSDSAEVNEWKEKFDNATHNASSDTEELRLEKIKTDNLQADLTSANTKLESASPWFEMKDEERKAEEERIAQEKAQQEAEAKAQQEEEQRIAEAQKVEEQRLAEEQRVAQEKADKEAEAKKYYTGITYENLARNPTENIGKLVRFKGKIIQIIKATGSVQYRMAIDNNYDKVVLITVDNSKLQDGNLLEDDRVTIEGTFLMEMEYETVRGDKRNIPAIIVENLYR